jgi:hypothetical protein
MLLTLLGAIAVAIFAAVCAWVVRRMTGLDAKWIIPAAAGAAMLGFTIWNDYDWFHRDSALLQEGVEVTQTFSVSRFLQPWTLLVPAIDRYQALDVGGRLTHQSDPDMVLARVILTSRWNPRVIRLQVFDCAQGRRADPPPSDADPIPAEGDWVALSPDDPLLQAACRGV